MALLSRSPIHRLPSEIVSSILTTTVDVACRSHRGRRYHALVLTLLTVCRLWHDVAVSEATLWNALDIYLEHSEESQCDFPSRVAFLQRWYERAGGLATQIVIQFRVTRTSNQMPLFIDFLTSKSRRWESILFINPPNIMSRSLLDIAHAQHLQNGTNFLQSVKALSLQDSCKGGRFDAPASILSLRETCSTNLKELELDLGRFSPEDIYPALHLPSLTRLILGSVSHIGKPLLSTILNSAPQLEILVLRELFGYYAPAEIMFTTLHASLKTLQIDNLDALLDGEFRNLRLPALQQLSLQATRNYPSFGGMRAPHAADLLEMIGSSNCHLTALCLKLRAKYWPAGPPIALTHEELAQLLIMQPSLRTLCLSTPPSMTSLEVQAPAPEDLEGTSDAPPAVPPATHFLNILFEASKNKAVLPNLVYLDLLESDGSIVSPDPFFQFINDPKRAGPADDTAHEATEIKSYAKLQQVYWGDRHWEFYWRNSREDAGGMVYEARTCVRYCDVGC